MLLHRNRELIGFLPMADLYTELAEHDRLRVFANKGKECVACGRLGTLLVISRETSKHRESRRKKTVGSVHVDLYTDEFVLMTVDHIIPKYICKQEGWTTEDMESLDNKQPMCDPCNSGKGHKIISPEELALRRQQLSNDKSRKVYGSEIVRELLPNIHAMLGNTV